MWRLICLLSFLFLSVIWCHHCDDSTNPYKKIKNSNVNKTHYCYNLNEDLGSFTCRCKNDASCKEPCGINLFRAWSSKTGSWIKNIPTADRIPFIPLSTYAKCVKVPGALQPPHRLPYTMCMCNDHYYSFDFNITDETRVKNFTKQLMRKLHFERPKMYVLGVDNYVSNLPYIQSANYSYRTCMDVSTGESYHPPGWLGNHWCNLTFCQTHSPFGKTHSQPEYQVMKCAETCTCFLKPNQTTVEAALKRNEFVDKNYSHPQSSQPPNNNPVGENPVQNIQNQ